MAQANAEQPSDRTETTARMGFKELTALTAAVMALSALGIDIMLPALGIISRDLGVVHENDRQLIVIVYVLINGLAQFFVGPLVDWYGRRRMLLIAAGSYAVAAFLSIFAPSFLILLAARGGQGACVAIARVAITATVRDQYAGRRMAELSSLAFTVLMAAPIVAPALGQLTLAQGTWRDIFLILAAYGLVVGGWAFFRMPETLAREARTPLSFASVFHSYGLFFRNRTALGYTFVGACPFGGLVAFISSAEQIFLETFAIGDLFALAFATMVVGLGVATLANARLVGRLGMRPLAHSALVLLLAVNLVHLLTINFVGETIWLFIGFMTVSFFALGVLAPNCGAIALEPMGKIAGAAAALNGALGTTLSALIGAMAARAYDGTTTPLVTALAILGGASLAIARFVETDGLFRARPASSDAVGGNQPSEH